jgi:hypothetical protein
MIENETEEGKRRSVELTKKKENGKRKKMGQNRVDGDENRMTEHTSLTHM